MALPAVRSKLLPLRGLKASLDGVLAGILEGEICYATDEDQYYQKEGGVLVQVGATKAQGTLASTSVQPNDNISTLTNDAAYITSAQAPVQPADLFSGDYDDLTNKPSIPAKTSDLTNDSNFITAAQAPVQTSDLPTAVSELANDSNFITASGAPVQSVAGKTGAVTLNSGDVGLANVDNTSDNDKPISAATQTALDAKAGSTATTDALALKADASTVNAALATKADDAATTAALATKADDAATTTALAGKADLIGGKLNPAQVPDIAVTQFLGVASSESAMLALSGEMGDWCNRSDTGQMFIIVGSDPSVIGGWAAVSYPASPVVSVAGKTGAVTLDYGDIGNTPTIPTDNNELTNGAGYVTSSGNTVIGTDSDIDTSGSTIIDKLEMTDGVITSHGTRNLTLGDLGYTGATNANYITNNNQISNGAGYATTSQLFSGSYNDLSNKPTIPTNNNQLSNGAGYITNANGGNAATLDGIDSSQFLRSDTADTASGDIYFSGGAGAVTINGSSDIRLNNGNWTGEVDCKIQHHDNRLYIQYPTNGVHFRNSGGTDRVTIANDGKIQAQGFRIDQLSTLP